MNFSTFGLNTGRVDLQRSQILGSPALSIRNNTTRTEIARIHPFHPEIPPMAAFSQRGRGKTLVSVAPGRTNANKIDKIFISFKRFHMEGSTPQAHGDAWIAISPTGKIKDTNLPLNTDMTEVAGQARLILQAIRDGKPITQEKWLRRYAKWQNPQSRSE